MLRKQKREEWLQDLHDRQRSVVFPRTATNEARFWRNLLEGKKRMTAVQKVGLTIMALVAAAVLFLFPSFRDWIIAFGILGGFSRYFL